MIKKHDQFKRPDLNELVLVKERIDKFIQKYLPEYITPEDNLSVVYQVLKRMKKALVSDLEGVENISAGPNLFIANHKEGDDIWKLMVALDSKVHIVGAENIHWKDSLLFGVKQKMMKQLEMLTIKESFSNIPENKVKEVIDRAPLLERAAHEKIAKQQNKLGGNITNIKQILAVLASGRNVEIFIDGPWTRLDGDKRIPYAGYGLIAKLYKKLTNEDLNILPVTFSQGRVSIGEKVNLSGSESKERLQEIAMDSFAKYEKKDFEKL